MKPDIINIELIVHYGLINDSIEISQHTGDEATFDFHILDKEQEHFTGRTTISFNNSKELIDIINDFNKRFNLIKNDNIR